MRKTHVFLKDKIGITLDNKDRWSCPYGCTENEDEDDFELLIGTLNETLSSMYGCHIAYDKTEKTGRETTFDGFAIFVDED